MDLAALSPILLSILIGTPTYLVWDDMKIKNQRAHDLKRDRFELIFPNDLRAEQVQDFARSIGRSLDNKLARFAGVPTVVFEVVASDKGISHYLRVPHVDSEYLQGQLDGHLPGIDVSPVESGIEGFGTSPLFGVDLRMSDPLRPLRINSVVAHSTKILKAIYTDHPGETVVLQWIVSHSNGSKLPDDGRTVMTSKPTLLGAFVFGLEAKPGEIKDRQIKAVEQQFAAAGRIVATAKDSKRAEQLVSKLTHALQSENKTNLIQVGRKIPADRLEEVVTQALTPPRFASQLTVTELSALAGWPLGNIQLPGLRQGSARRFPATEAFAREGWVLGHSDVPGRNRPIALSPAHMPKHTIIVGSSGSGKTSLMGNGGIQVAQQGYGLFVIDAGTDVSQERLFYRVLNGLPVKRLRDIVLVNPAENREFPVSINLLDQGFGLGVIDQIVGVFETLYPSIKEGVSVRELLYFGLWTLLEAGGYTLIDLASLLSPRNPVERAWAKQLIEGVKDPELKDFWDRNPGATADPTSGRSTKADEWARYVQPLHRRLWQLAGRPEIRNIIGQTKSTINLREIVAHNKILLVSVGGLPDDTAELFSTLIFNQLWAIAQQTRVEKMNVLMIDEFQVAANVRGGLPDVLARGRAHKLGLVLGTQFITRRVIGAELQGSVINNTATKIVLKSSAQEAALWARELGGRQVAETDISKLRPYHGMAQIANDAGDSSPVTFRALKPPESTGITRLALDRNLQRYGRPVEQVREEIANRRQPAVKATRAAKPQGITDYDPDEEA
ncbi:type IV secretory system conjugative DNA transfer family protein [Nocardia sp. NPDC055165]